MDTKIASSQFHQVNRRNDLLQEQLRDNDKAKDKLHEWIACPNCGAVYQERREQQRISHAVAHGKTCPACHHIEGDTTAGFLILHGCFFLTHREEIRRMILNLEERERNDYPLKRIIDVKDGVHITFITTNDIDFTRKIGEALYAKHQGCLEFLYNKEKNLIDVDWQC